MLSIVGSYLIGIEKETMKVRDDDRSIKNHESGNNTYASENVPVTKELVSDDLPTARNPRMATFRWTSVGLLLLLIWRSFQFVPNANVCRKKFNRYTFD